MPTKPDRPTHQRPTPEKLDECISLDHDAPEAVIEALLHVNTDGPPEIEDAARDEMEIPADETDEG